MRSSSRACPRPRSPSPGYGSEEPRLRLLVRSAGLNDVRFVGRVEPEDMPRVYDDADIFLNASVVDNQPVSILEAFAAGLPVVSTPTGDIGALVRHHDTGLLVPPFDPGAIASAVEWLLAHPDRAGDFAAARARLHRQIHVAGRARGLGRDLSHTQSRRDR